MNSVDVQNYVAALRRNHPFEKAEYLLESLRPPAGEGASLPQDIKIVPLASAQPEQAKEPAPSRSRIASRILGAFSPRNVVATRRDGTTPARTAKNEDIYPLRFEPDWSRPRHEQADSDSSWSLDAIISTVLLVIVLLGGIVLAAYTVARPLLPEHWLP
jgi:hypothetical protein